MRAATTSTIPGGAAGVFLQFSVLGAVALLGLWFVLTAYRREVARGDAAEKALAELNREVRDKVIPALTDAARAMSDCVGLLRDKR
jgi:hypothetical protein